MSRASQGSPSVEVEVRKIVAPVAPLAPGSIIVYYEIQTRA